MTTMPRHDDFGNSLSDWPRHPAMHVGTRIGGEWWHHIPWDGWCKMRPSLYLEPTQHRCRPPVDESCCGPGFLHATEPRGSFWQCGCGTLWRVGLDIQFGNAWSKAGWLARRKYQRQTKGDTQ